MVITIEWLSISDISKRLGVAENTARRYCSFFGDFLQERKFGRTTKYTTDAIEVISRVSVLYGQGLSTEEIQSKLREELPQVLDLETSHEVIVTTNSSYEILQQLAYEQVRQREEQERFNSILLDRLDEQQRYIEESLLKRNTELTETLRAIMDVKQEKKKKWWIF